jgi:hypothetical protein
MPRRPDSAHIDLAEVFRRVQHEMLAQLSVGRLFEHGSSQGAATERHWRELLERYLPQRYRAAPAFVIDRYGRRSRQIDLAIFDNLSSPQLFPHFSGAHIPAESVYAIFEIKPTFSKQWLRDAGEKAASVRSLSGASPKLLSGLLATGSVWNTATFPAGLTRALSSLPHANRIDIGCSLQQGAPPAPPTPPKCPTTSSDRAFCRAGVTACAFLSKPTEQYCGKIFWEAVRQSFCTPEPAELRTERFTGATRSAPRPRTRRA